MILRAIQTTRSVQPRLRACPANLSLSTHQSGGCVATSCSDADLPSIVQDGGDTGAVLRQVAQDVPTSMFGTVELRRLADQMIDVMRQAPGVGLAAPQIGVSLKVIVAEDREEYMQKQLTPEQQAELGRFPFGPLVVCNPRLSPVGQEGFRYWEGCLSVDGFQAMVERYSKVNVSAFDVAGKPLEFQAEGWKARILQHEVDHVNGVLYTDRLVKSTLMPRKPPAEAESDLSVQTGPCVCTHQLL